jgi:hypothetical protein
LIKEPGQIKTLGTEALSTARQLDIRILVKELLNVYENPMS